MPNPDIDKQRESVRYWRNRARRLQPLEDAAEVLSERQLTDYLGTLGVVFHVAFHGVSRRSVMKEASALPRSDVIDPGNRATLHGSKHASGEHATGLSKPIGESKPPAYDARALALLRAELKHLDGRRRVLLAKL